MHLFTHEKPHLDDKVLKWATETLKFHKQLAWLEIAFLYRGSES